MIVNLLIEKDADAIVCKPAFKVPILVQTVMKTTRIFEKHL